MPRSYSCEFSRSRLDGHSPSVENFSAVFARRSSSLSGANPLFPRTFKSRVNHPAIRSLHATSRRYTPPNEVQNLKVIFVKSCGNASRQQNLPESVSPGKLDLNRPAFPTSSIASLGLSIEGMNKVLSFQHRPILDLLDSSEVNKRASILSPSDDEFESVLLTEPSTAATRLVITAMQVIDVLKFQEKFLEQVQGRNRRQPIPLAPLHPHPARSGVRDRHVSLFYSGCNPVDRPPLQLTQAISQRRIQYVRCSEKRYLRRVICRTRRIPPDPPAHNQSHTVEVLPVADPKTASGYLVGRITQIESETLRKLGMREKRRVWK